MIAAVPLRLSYSIFQLVLLLAHRLAHRVYKDVEVLALCDEAAELRRTNWRPRLGWADRAVLWRERDDAWRMGVFPTGQRATCGGDGEVERDAGVDPRHLAL